MTNEPQDLDDGRCVKCGRCCRVGTKNLCPNLHPATNLCDCYETRFQGSIKRPFKCRSIPEAITEGLLPVDCPYVKGIEGYSCRVPGRI